MQDFLIGFVTTNNDIQISPIWDIHLPKNSPR